jgi:cytosine/uracil/thiamine/allantoin permease
MHRTQSLDDGVMIEGEMDMIMDSGLSDRLYTRWGNCGIFPISVEQRRFTIVSYFSFWAVASMSVIAWAYGEVFWC